jgi:hypothetical protein
VLALLVSGCGGGTRADHGEASASFAVQVVKASFPHTQAVAKPAQLTLEVRNTGPHTVPNLAISVDSFNYRSNYPGLADALRPTWVIERGPGPVAKPAVESQEVSQGGGAQTSYVNTWSLGSLHAGQTRTFVWNVVAVKAGNYTVNYSVAAGLGGKAKAVTSSGAAVSGKLTADVASAPPDTHVNGATGQVVPGAVNAAP